MKFEGFVGPSYALSSLAADAQRAVNLYPEAVESGSGKAKYIYRTTPGALNWAVLPTGPVRGLFVAGGGDFEVLYAVGGSKLYRVDSAGVATELGDVGTDAADSPAQIFPNGEGTAILIISAGQAWYHNGVILSAAPVPADDDIDPAYPGGQVGTAATGAFLNWYWIVSKPDSKKVFYSFAPGDEWNPLDQGTKEGFPDNVARVLADHQELWLFGDATTEGWGSTTDADNPFLRRDSAVMPMGIAARWTAVNLIDGPAWLGGDPHSGAVAYRARGFQPMRVSTHAVEQAWREYSKVSDARAYVYTEAGHTFWVISFPTGNATWVYDLTTNMWHERGYWNGSALDHSMARCHAFCYGLHLAGSRLNGKILDYSLEMLQEDAATLPRIRTAPHLSDEDKQIFHHRVSLDIDDFDNSHDEAKLEWSDDAGQTWSTPRNPDTSSAIPKKKRRLTWRRLGAARDRIYRVTFNQSAPLTLIGANIDITPGTN